MAGDISLVRYFDTWNADPQIIRSTDVAGITYHPPSGHLYLVDSEIDEIPEIFNGDNLFEVSLLGDQTYRTIASNNTEPTGIAYNAKDGFFYITNDNTRRLTRYDGRLNVPLAFVDTRQAVPDASDPEDVASDPETGFLYVVDGVGGGVQVLVYDSNLSFQYRFPVSSRVEDPEGIAFHPTLRHLFLVSAADKKVFEYTLDGTFVEQYDYSGLSPRPSHSSGLTFAPTSDLHDDPAALSLYMTDEGRDNYPDGGVFEVSITRAQPPWIVHGTPEGDLFEFFAASTSGQRVLRVNGRELPIPPASVHIELDGAGGNDELRIVGSDGADTAQIRPNAAIVRSGAYTLSAIQVETVRFDGAGGNDAARLHGSRRADLLTAGGNGSDLRQTTLAASGVSLTATAETLYAYGGHGKNTASLSLSAGDVLQQFWKWLQTRHNPDPNAVGDEYSRILRGFQLTFSDNAPVSSQVLAEQLWLAELARAEARDRATGKAVIQGNCIDDVFACWGDGGLG